MSDSKIIIDFLKEEIAAAVNKQPDDIDENANFLSLGVSSIQTLKIINRLQKKLEIEINPIAMFEYKNIALFSEYLSQCVDEEAIVNDE